MTKLECNAHNSLCVYFLLHIPQLIYASRKTGVAELTQNPKLNKLDWSDEDSYSFPFFNPIEERMWCDQ